jgi:hypothetical protein
VSGLTLLPSGGLPPTGGPTGGGWGGGGAVGPSGGEGGDGEPEAALAAFQSSEEFTALEPDLAERSLADREYYHGSPELFTDWPRDYAYDAAAQEQINAAIGYVETSGAVAEALRADFRDGAQRLTRDIAAARARSVFRVDVLADAFGVAQWAIGVRAGDPAPPDRLAMLPDSRLRFVVGAAAVSAGPTVAAR